MLNINIEFKVILYFILDILFDNKIYQTKNKTIKIPKIVNHFAASVSINLLNLSPNLNDR